METLFEFDAGTYKTDFLVGRYHFPHLQFDNHQKSLLVNVSIKSDLHYNETLGKCPKQ